jgi:RNA polymerase sigma-B factor
VRNRDPGSALNTGGADRRAPAAQRRGTTALLLRAYHEDRDLAARQRLIELHLPLVRAVARGFAHRGESLEDLVQVGSIGLIKAVDRFDPTKGRDLASFAVPTIAGEIRNHLRDRATVVRIPRRTGQLNARLRREREDLAASLHRPPTMAELARQAGMAEREVAAAVEAEGMRSPLPLEATVNGGEVDNGASAAIAVDDVFASSNDRLLLVAGFRVLDARQRRILHLRFFAGMSQAEIAREVGLSQVQVSRVIRGSLERMRDALGRDPSVASSRTPCEV